MAGRDFISWNPITVASNILGTGRDALTEYNKEVISRAAGDNSYDIRNPLSPEYRTTPNFTAVLGDSTNTPYTEGSGATTSASSGNPTDQTSVYNGTNTGSGSGTTGTSYDPADLAYLDTQKSLYESLYGKLDDTRSDGLQNLQDQYRLGLNKANTSRSRALEGYQTQEEDTKRSKVNAFNNVDQNTNSLANSVRRLLGLAGAAGSSAALYDLPAGIAREASRNRGNVMSDFATNMRGLDQARKYSEDDYNALLGDLERQKATGTENFEAGILGQRQNIQNTLADIAARRAKLLGQDPNSALQGYQEKYLNFQDQIQGLPEKYRQAVTARDVAVQPVSLKDYMVDRAAINANRQMGQDPASPYAQFLKKQQEEEQL